MKDSSNFIVVSCTLRKRDEQKFLECMADLKRALLIEGNAEYASAIDWFQGLVGGDGR